MRALRLLPALALLLTLAACDSADDETLAGTYRATRFQADTDDDDRTPQVDILSLGASLTMTLRDDGTFNGVLTVPESLTGDEIEPITPFNGTYISSPSTVTFRSDSGLFIDEAAWTYADGEIRTESFGSVVVLEKQ